jgi:hypothetical protein
MLTGCMDDAVIVHSAIAVYKAKLGTHHFYLAGVRCLWYSWCKYQVLRCMENLWLHYMSSLSSEVFRQTPNSSGASRPVTP